VIRSRGKICMYLPNGYYERVEIIVFETIGLIILIIQVDRKWRFCFCELEKHETEKFYIPRAGSLGTCRLNLK